MYPYKELLNETDKEIMIVIDKLRFTGVGEPYSEKGRRNPIRDDTGPLLNGLVLMHKPRQIVELGTAYGLSSLWMLLGNAAQLDTCDFDEKITVAAQQNFVEAGVADRVVVHTGDAGEVLKQYTTPIDLIFLDHEKGLYLPHLKLIEPILQPNALIVADNVNDRRKEAQPFVDYVSQEYHTKIIPTECGLLIASKQSF